MKLQLTVKNKMLPLRHQSDLQPLY